MIKKNPASWLALSITSMSFLILMIGITDSFSSSDLSDAPFPRHFRAVKGSLVGNVDRAVYVRNSSYIANEAQRLIESGVVGKMVLNQDPQSSQMELCLELNPTSNNTEIAALYDRMRDFSKQVEEQYFSVTAMENCSGPHPHPSHHPSPWPHPPHSPHPHPSGHPVPSPSYSR